MGSTHLFRGWYTWGVMSQIVRHPVKGPGAKTKVLLVRHPVKTPGSEESTEHERATFRVWMGVIVAVGVLGAVWLIGTIGFHLGYAPMMRTPDMVLGSGPGPGLSMGIGALMESPWFVLEAGMNRVGWLMVVFAGIALPAASLSAIKEYPKGGPRVPQPVVVFSYLGATAAVVFGGLLVWWVGSAERAGMLGMLPSVVGGGEVSGGGGGAVSGGWIVGLRTAAGFDVLAVVMAALWSVLTLRLVIPGWLRAISAAVSFFALAVVIVAMAGSTVSAAQAMTKRSLVQVDEGFSGGAGGSGLKLVIGQTRHKVVLLRRGGGSLWVEQRDRPSVMTVVGVQSVVEFVGQQE